MAASIRHAKYRAWANKQYKSARWKQARKSQLTRYPYCQCPHHKGKDRSALATVVDHIKPHRGDSKLFWNQNNHQSMMKVCHDSFKQSEEKGGSGFNKGCDDQGNPLSSTHEWWS